MFAAQAGTILQPGRLRTLRCGSNSFARRHGLPFSAHPCGFPTARLNIFPNLRSGLASLKAQDRDSGNGLESSSDSSMSALNVPSTSGQSNSKVGGSDGGNPQQRPPNLLQRLAFSIAGLWAGLWAALLAWLKTFSPRTLRAAVLIALGITTYMFTHPHAGRGTTGSAAAGPQEVIYSRFLNMVDSGNVAAARFEDGTGRILFDLRPHSSEQAAKAVQQHQEAGASSSAAEAAANTVEMSEHLATVKSQGRSATPRQFYTRHVPDPQLIARLMAASVEFGSVRASMSAGLVRALTTMMALWLPLIPMFIIMRRFLDGRNGAKKRKGGSPEKGVPPTTFADVAGVGPAKQELLEVVACLRDSRRFARLGAKMPSGVLLCGPPGTGKTLLAKAVAGEAGVPFIAVSASEFVEMFVGRGAARVRELFAEARKQAPCVIFIDELDAVGGKRGAGLNEERDQTLNQLLTELDGFDGRPGVLLLAATNRPEVLDAALLRPGRLSRRVNVPLPDEPGRAAISSVHLRKVPLEGGEGSSEAAAALIARLSNGLSGAELANVVNEAAFLAARRGGDTVALGDLVDAITRTRYGVGGGAPAGPIARRIRDWVIDYAGSGKQTQTQPMGS